MPRGPRLDAPGALHHVMGRGIERRPIFLDDRDQLDFLARLERLTESGALAVYAWALMWNHFHLLCRTGNAPLSRSMSSLLTGYAAYFNRRHQRVGHLFQNRFKSVLCEEAGYFRELVRYIHLNPVRADMVGGIDELDRHPWTGHAALMGRQAARMLDVAHVLSAFGPTIEEARVNYRRFIVEGLEPAEAEATRKGRTWKHLAFLARQIRKSDRDERILGSVEFFERIRSEVVSVARPPAAAAPKIELSTLVALVAAQCGTTQAALAAGSKLPACARAREGVAYLWLEAIGGPCRDLVTALGVGEPSIYRAARRGRGQRERWDPLLRVSSLPEEPLPGDVPAFLAFHG